MQTIVSRRSTIGISLKTQILYCIVFITRYFDLLWTYVSFYNTAMKLFFITSSCYTVYLMMYKFNNKNVVKQEIDTFKVKYLLAGSLVMLLLFHHKFTFTELLWSFSLWLESVAIFPQLMVLTRTGELDTLTTNYIFALGCYRAFYIPNWIYRWATEGRFEKLAVFTGLLQTVLYSDFFWVYYQNVIKGKSTKLPV